MTALLPPKPPARPDGSEQVRPARAGRSSRTPRPGFLWTLPATAFFLLFAVVPLIAVVVLSFMSWRGIGEPKFVGLENWEELAGDPVMMKSL